MNRRSYDRYQSPFVPDLAALATDSRAGGQLAVGAREFGHDRLPPAGSGATAADPDEFDDDFDDGLDEEFEDTWHGAGEQDAAGIVPFVDHARQLSAQEFEADVETEPAPDGEYAGDVGIDAELRLDEETELGDIEEFDEHAEQLLSALEIELGADRDDVVQALEEQRFADAAQRVILGGEFDAERLTDMLVLAKHPELLYAPELESDTQREDRRNIGRLVRRAIAAATGGVRGLGGLVRGGKTAEPQPARRRPARSDPLQRFVCTADDVTAINQALGLSIDEQALRRALRDAIERAQELAGEAADRLRGSRLRGAEGEATTQAFRRAFGVTPGFAPAWRPKGATWTRGSIVRVRLTRARRQLGRGAHRIFCWGPTRVAQGHWQPAHRILPHKQSRSLYLGQGLWHALLVAREPDPVAASLLSGTLTVNYRTIRKQHPHNHFGTAACYVRFAFEANALAAPAGAVERCNATGS